jgi:sugar O-acyltransferase (sialic acid O-acetyltransferase NeuD family)
MMKKEGKIVIIGAGEFAQIAYEYFTHDSPYEVVAFSAEKRFIDKNELLGLPVVPFEELEQFYSPKDYGVYVAVTYTQLNRVRTRLYRAAKAKGYLPVSYVSSKAFVWHNVDIGENSFVFENNVLQHMVKIGNNVVLWSGNHVGHRTVIRDNVYVSSHCVISGYCDIGESCFLGVNSTYNDRVKVAKDCIIGSGTLVIRDTEPGKVYVGSPAKASEKSSYQAFQVKEEES